MFCAIWYHLYNLKKHPCGGMSLFLCEKHPWRNVTFSKAARSHYSWKYIVRSNVNSDLCTVTIFCSLVESIPVIKKM